MTREQDPSGAGGPSGAPVVAARSHRWWLAQAKADRIQWTVAAFDTTGSEWYVGDCDSQQMRAPALWGFRIAYQCLIPELEAFVGDRWLPLTDDEPDDEQHFLLWREARYRLIIQLDCEPPHADDLYDVFLSYRRTEAALAERVAERLREGGVTVWFDRWLLPTVRERPLEFYLRHAIKRSAVMLRIYDTEGDVMAHMNDYDRWYQCEFIIGSTGFPLHMSVHRARYLDEDFDSDVPRMIEEYRGRAVRDRDIIVQRVWTDEDPALYLRPSLRASPPVTGR